MLSAKASGPDSERSIRAKQLREHERTLARLAAEVVTATAETVEMARQSQVGSYGRIHTEPKR